MSKHIMFDLETLGNHFNAPIISIGAVKFNPYYKLQSELIEDRFEALIDWNTLSKYGFKVDYSTIKWWLTQGKAAISSLFNPEKAKYPIDLALDMFQQWIGDSPGDYYYWSHATFDPPILNNAFRETGKRNPIPFRKQRDLRTLIMLAGEVDLPREGVAHCALDDCIYQATYASIMLKRLANKGVKIL